MVRRSYTQLVGNWMGPRSPHMQELQTDLENLVTITRTATNAGSESGDEHTVAMSLDPFMQSRAQRPPHPEWPASTAEAARPPVVREK